MRVGGHPVTCGIGRPHRRQNFASAAASNAPQFGHRTRARGAGVPPSTGPPGGRGTLAPVGERRSPKVASSSASASLSARALRTMTATPAATRIRPLTSATPFPERPPRTKVATPRIASTAPRKIPTTNAPGMHGQRQVGENPRGGGDGAGGWGGSTNSPLASLPPYAGPHSAGGRPGFPSEHSSATPKRGTGRRVGLAEG